MRAGVRLGLRGWRNTVGNLIEICWLKMPIMGLDLLVYVRNAEVYGFIEFETSNGTIATVFRQPLIGTPRPERA